MLETKSFEEGGYRYILGPFQYSGGVAAKPGYTIERVVLKEVAPVAQGFDLIEFYLEKLNRPKKSFCACELRSPAQFSEEEFAAFNRDYVSVLESWGIYKQNNPVARSNVCPEIDGPDEPGFLAFSYTMPTEKNKDDKSFVIAGSGEAPEGLGGYKDHIVRLGETSDDAMQEKARYVLNVMEERMAALGVAWSDATVTQAYTVYNLFPFFPNEIVARGAAKAGLNWNYARPPVVGLDFEMDVRRTSLEKQL